MANALDQMKLAPVNTTVIALCSVVWFYMWNRRVPPDNVSISYTRVVSTRQYYRCVTAALVHLSWLHIIFNMISLWSVWVAEAEHGSYWYWRTTTQLLLLSKLLYLGIVFVMATRMGRTGAADQEAAGYSGVIFGWFALIAMEHPESKMAMFGIPMPALLTPVVALVITQLIIRRASFVGHLAGMLVGYAMGAGGLSWVPDFWWWSFAGLSATVMVLSLKSNPAFAGWRILRCIQISPEYAAIGPWALFAGPTSSTLSSGGSGDGSSAGGAGSAAVPRRYMDGGILHVDRSVELLPQAATSAAGRVAAAASRDNVAVTVATPTGGGAAARPVPAAVTSPSRQASAPPPATSSTGAPASAGARAAARSPSGRAQGGRGGRGEEEEEEEDQRVHV